jgi:anaerobic magnesium-protoporphyrin IX monomethyl ester cyclase
LVNPPVSSKQIYGEWALSSVDTYSPPLGLLYLAGYLREHKHHVSIIDAPARKWSLNDTVRYILDLNPDVVGITSLTINIPNAAGVAETLKRSGLRSPIVIGGSHISAVPYETFIKYPLLDYGVIGEGELTFKELVERLQKHEPVDQVEGIIWRNSKGDILINPPRPLVRDLDTLPYPAWDLLPCFPEAYPQNALETKRLPAASIITSRGCMHQCTFCDRTVFGSMVRHHSAEYTLAMIRHLKNTYGIKDLMILDDIFLLDKNKLSKICQAIIQEKLDLKWYCLSHIKFMTEERLKLVKDAGCWIMEVGIESGCERILRLLKRNTSKAEIAEAVRKAHEIGIRVKGNFIFGLPTETPESLEETIQFAKDIDISLFQQNFLTIFPGCELSEDAEKYGRVEKEWDNLSLWKITFVPFGLSEKELLKASKTAFRKFYLRPKIILGVLSFLRSCRALRSVLAAAKAFFLSLLRKS